MTSLASGELPCRREIYAPDELHSVGQSRESRQENTMKGNLYSCILFLLLFFCFFTSGIGVLPIVETIIPLPSELLDKRIIGRT